MLQLPAQPRFSVEENMRITETCSVSHRMLITERRLAFKFFCPPLNYFITTLFYTHFQVCDLVIVCQYIILTYQIHGTQKILWLVKKLLPTKQGTTRPQVSVCNIKIWIFLPDSNSPGKNLKRKQKASKVKDRSIWQFFFSSTVDEKDNVCVEIWETVPPSLSLRLQNLM